MQYFNCFLAANALIIISNYISTMFTASHRLRIAQHG